MISYEMSMANSKDISVPGFLAGGKRGGKYGVAIVASEEEATCSLMVTANRIRAAPLEVSIEHGRDRKARAVVISSGNANAFTGQRGVEDARAMAGQTAAALGMRAEDVIVNSTGIIGQPLDMDEIRRLIDDVSAGLNSDDNGITAAADAMRTTDSFEKVSSRTAVVDGRTVRITGIAKGAGMIAPQLRHATMIAVIMTDARLSPEEADALLGEAVEKSFNMAVVDGDTSTNDMVVLLANGKAGNNGINEDLRSALEGVCTDLARMIVRDGEGATKLFEVEIRGARSPEDAKRAARAVAGSTLVKTAVFGENPNWGRVIAAVGYSGAEFEASKLSLRVKNEERDVPLVRDGVGVALKGSAELKAAAEVFKGREFRFIIDLGAGQYTATAFGCDLGHSYVKVNAEYTT
ncbi:MAG: bifunctional glutamate N-acetyltransferase/amino-acid acetyltransferase ArgJ [Methanobacteriota archaeon]|nr:MAG: bifunctional glutamate N-acetyltransferase/amino-acid acetyltransferase ArgJ [Euryarchaeota archaeon]